MGQVKYISKDYGTYDAFNIDEYIKRGGFSGLKKAIEQGYEKTTDDVAKSGLQGRGGANYPTGKNLLRQEKLLEMKKDMFFVMQMKENQEHLKINIYLKTVFIK